MVTRAVHTGNALHNAFSIALKRWNALHTAARMRQVDLHDKSVCCAEQIANLTKVMLTKEFQLDPTVHM